MKLYVPASGTYQRDRYCAREVVSKRLTHSPQRGYAHHALNVSADEPEFPHHS